MIDSILNSQNTNPSTKGHLQTVFTMRSRWGVMLSSWPGLGTWHPGSNSLAQQQMDKWSHSNNVSLYLRKVPSEKLCLDLAMFLPAACHQNN